MEDAMDRGDIASVVPEKTNEQQEAQTTAADIKVQYECLELFSSNDFIMEPTIFDTIKTYFMHGGEPGPVVDLLSDNYTAVAQTVNLLAEWLIITGMPVEEVQLIVENHLKNLIMKHFDPKKADTIFNLEGGAPSWLTEMIEHSIWRKMLYILAEQHPNCLMLNFTIKLISDSGYENEISSVAVASQQVEVFSKVFKTSTAKFVKDGIEKQHSNLNNIIGLSCRGEHTYLYSQMLLNSLYDKDKNNCIESGSFISKRISQEIELAAREKNYNVTAFTLALNSAAAYPKVYSGLDSMLTKNVLNTSDITNLFKFYSSQDPPPVSLIRNTKFLDMLINYFFELNSKPHPDHKNKYSYLLAYAASVSEAHDNQNERISINKSELEETQEAIENAHTICSENKASSDILADLSELFKCMLFPVVSVGIIKWIEYIILDPSYFKLNTDDCPIHLILLDEIIQNQKILHDRILKLLIKLFQNNFPDLDYVFQIQLKKAIIDRMLNLICRGYVLPTIAFINQCWKEEDTDVSLIRHFVTEVLYMIRPPYSTEFMNLFLPLINNVSGNNALKQEEVQEFINYCKQNNHAETV